MEVDCGVTESVLRDAMIHLGSDLGKVICRKRPEIVDVIALEPDQKTWSTLKWERLQMVRKIKSFCRDYKDIKIQNELGN